MEISHDRESDAAGMSLAEARELAANEKSGWCITPEEFELTVGRLVVGDDLRIVKVCCDEGKVLRFPSIPSAREFLWSELAVSRSMLIPLLQ